MIHGLTKFADWFADHREKYVLIGGCAASTVMEEAGLTFRATKDLDVVLIVEAVDRSFGPTLWEPATPAIPRQRASLPQGPSPLKRLPHKAGRLCGRNVLPIHRAGRVRAAHAWNGRCSCFNRFSNPGDESFLKMIELFSRLPDWLSPLEEDNRTTPVPIDEDVSSLSAILLDEEACRFVCDGRIEIGGIPSSMRSA